MMSHISTTVFGTITNKMAASKCKQTGKILKKSLYQNIVDEIQLLPVNTNETIQLLSKKFPKTLGSIFGQEYQKKTKRLHQKHYNSDVALSYYSSYLREISRHCDPGVILRMAENVELSPCLLARIILEQYLLSLNQTEEPVKQQISRLMKDTSLIKDKNLAFEVYLCVLQDDNYGPYADIIKHSFGHEYECKLRKILQDEGLSFIVANCLGNFKNISEEVHMRDKGYDKTPDFKMEVPFAVNGYIINWVESKASFGDEESHQNYLKDQFWSYWNRFGSGMVIYWFGYVEELDIHRQKGILLKTDLDTCDIIKMDPTSI